MTDLDILPRELDSVTLFVDQEKISLFAEMSNDFNPIHIDPIVAEASPLGGIIAHGSLALNLIWLSLEKTLTPRDFVGTTLDVRLKAPAYLGDTLQSGGDISPENLGYKVWVSNQNDIRIIEGLFSFSSDSFKCKNISK